MTEERVIRAVRPSAVLQTIGVMLGVAVAVLVVWAARHALVWITVALFFALALDPAVRALQRRGLRRRGWAVAVVYLAGVLIIVGIAAAFVPLVVSQATSLADAAPGYIRDLTRGHGPLASLESQFHLSDKARRAVAQAGPSTALSLTRTVATGVAGVVTIAFLTLFMLLEGPAWRERIKAALPARQRGRWTRVGAEISRTIGGYVSGNLLISLIAGAATALVLAGVGAPYPVALGVLVGLLDLIPMAGAPLAGVIVTLVALTHSTTAAIIVAAFFLIYQQIENHVLQPLVYGRTVELSPLTVLVSILIGIQLGGILGALAAIPAAGTIRVLARDWLAARRAGERPEARFARPAVAGRPDIAVSGQPREPTG